MRKKLLIESIIGVVSLLNTTEAKAQALQRKILLNPSTYSLELHLEPLKDLKLRCESQYIRLEPNGVCSMEYRKRFGVGEIELKGYKPLLDDSYFIGLRYRIEW